METSREETEAGKFEDKVNEAELGRWRRLEVFKSNQRYGEGHEDGVDKEDIREEENEDQGKRQGKEMKNKVVKKKDLKENKKQKERRNRKRN